MVKKLTLVLMALMFVISCQGNSKSKDLKSFTKDFNLLETKFKEKESNIKSYKEYTEFKSERKKEYTDLLDKYKESSDSDGMNLLKAKAFIVTEDLDKADQLADSVITSGGEFVNDAKMVKVLVLFGKKKIDEAYTIFSEIESKLEKDDNYYSALINFSFEAPDVSVRKNYSEKLIKSSQLPDKFKGYRYMFFANLASIAKEEKDINKAKEILKKAISEVDDPRGKNSLKSELDQLEFIGKEAPDISAEMWVNSSPLSLRGLKGKVVIIDFWAPWCSPCRAVIPGLVEEYEKLKDKGLVVIGFTKLYGSYRDDVKNEGKVDNDKEKELIKEFVNRFNISYPVAISNEGKDFNAYKISGIPTMIFINRAGEIDHIKIGSGDHASVKKRIMRLLEEK